MFYREAVLKKTIIVSALGVAVISAFYFVYYSVWAPHRISANIGHHVIVITQKGQEFQPSNITIKRGDIVEIFNNDGNFLHHAYIAQSDFHYDSGDQLPGTRSDIDMVKSGTFTVLCGIHPQMHLRIVVH